MTMTLMSLFSAGKPFSGNIPSKIKFTPPCMTQQVLQDLPVLLSPHIPFRLLATHMKPNDHQLPELLFPYSVSCGSFSLESHLPLVTFRVMSVAWIYRSSIPSSVRLAC